MTQQKQIQWYVLRNDKEQLGPVSPSQLKAMAANGEINRDTMLKRSDSDKQLPAYRVRGLFALPPQPPSEIQGGTRSSVAATPAKKDAIPSQSPKMASFPPIPSWVFIFGIVIAWNLFKRNFPEMATSIGNLVEFVIVAVVLFAIAKLLGEEKHTK